MDEALILLGFTVVGGWILGIAGFIRASSVRRELRAVRRELTDLTARLADPALHPAPSPAMATAAQPAASPPPAPARLPPAPIEAQPAGQEVPAPRPEPAVPAPERPKLDLETLLTARWGIWLGAAALLLAAVFLIRYAVEESLLGPGSRCAAAALLGLALLGAAEWLSRHEPPALPGPLKADQAPGGLAAGGVAMLFGAAYGVGPFYELIPDLAGFLAMGAAALLGLGASLRYGQLTAAIGVAGAFVTPALVQTNNPTLPGLFLYLTVASAAALGVVRYTAWTWLGWVTAAAGAIWIILGGLEGGAGVWADAAFVFAAAALNLTLLPAAALDHPIGRRLAWIPFAVLGASGLALEIMVHGPEPRIALFALSPLAVWRGHTERRLDRLPWLAALAGLLALLFWALPDWKPTGEIISVEGLIEAVLPGAWAPEVIQPLIFSACLLAAFHAAAGSWQERRAPNPLHWAALVAAVPVLTFVVAYAQIDRFQTSFVWASVALALAAALTGAATLAVKEGSRQRAGIHAAGAAAALALGCSALLREQWLTLAISLFLPALAWIEAASDLPPLRRVAQVVAVLVLARLTLNWYVLDYAFGSWPLANGLIGAYAAPALSFAGAAYLFRRRGDDLLVATLEAGAVALGSLFIALELRHGFGHGKFIGDPEFIEVALHLLTLGIQAIAYHAVAERTGRRVFFWAARILGGLAMLAWTLLLFGNPGFSGDKTEPIILIVAYLLPAGLAMHARSRVASPRLQRALAGYALVSVFVWITLAIRHKFHPDDMSLFNGPFSDPELWSWSGGWLAYGAALMAWGIRANDKGCRLAALAVIGLVCAKVFLIDMSDLGGLWRVVSFLGLGVALIGLGAVHRRFVLPMKPKPGEQG